MTVLVKMRQLIGARHVGGLQSATLALAIALLAYMIAVCWAFFGFAADDALIVARYARNAVAGHGLVFNPGDTVTALTSPFQGFVLTALTAVTDKPVVAYKLICIGMVSATLVWMSIRLFQDGCQRIGFLVLTAGSPFVVVWTVGGLETPMLLSVLGLFCVAAWRDEGSAAGQSASVAVYFLAALAFLIRHDSALLTAPVVAYQFYVNRHSLRHWIALLLASTAPFGWLAFSAAYYGDILPTSFYWKSPEVGWIVVLGLIYMLSFLILSGAVPSLFAGSGPSWSQADGLRRNRPILVGLMVFGVYATAAGIVHMMFSYRLYVPMLPIVMVVAFSLARSFNQGIRSAGLAAAALLLQAGLSAFIYSSTLNPTLLHAFGSASPRYFEYALLSLRSYAGDFLPAMAANARDAQDHWEGIGPHDRPPRVHTFAAGVLPSTFREAYIFDSLSGYRHGCALNWTYWRRASDYLHIIWPLHGPPEDQLGHLADRVELVSRQVIPFDGRQEHIEIYFNPRPDPIRNSDRIDRPC